MNAIIVTTPPAWCVAIPRHGSVPRPPRPTTKIHRILRELAGGRSLNRFEAERLHDHCLHSTVSAIERRYGVRVERRDEVIPGYMGATTHCCRYWMDAESRKRALELLGEEDQCRVAA